ncbi:HAMP domain-containing histidine kinase [Clostridium sp. 'deep sea']|uniref:sensor histidine kinase n=1 Tax=Clostridium sp. 'deep sea' TaxID=2779445 RepID=UPI0018964194|nr:HAMP domain-containing sensor histidine kinase [Clostridium sp. 'deep sea']QOR36560.1 HAMP domain-containing histidine kinase [Clostridium sp. 'deep sea']
MKRNSQSIVIRITIVHVAIIILVSVSVVLSVTLTLSNYIMQRSHYELTTTASAIVNVVKNFGLRDFSSFEEWLNDEPVLQRDAKVIILDNHFNIKINSSNNELFGGYLRLPIDFQSQILSGKEKGAYKGYLYAVKPITTSGVGLTLGYVLALSNHQETIIIRNSILSSVLRIIFVAVLLGIVFSGYITRRLIQPLQKLEVRIKEIASGEFEGKLEVEIDDEIGDVTKAFNKMSKQLVQYNQAQVRFIQNASHELKSPLMNIQGYAEGLQEEIFNDEEEENAYEIISEECQRLKNLIEELLYISKIDDDKAKLEFQTIRISDVVNDAIRTVYTRIKQSNIDLQVNINEEIVVDGNYAFLVRAVANILDNAVRHTRSFIRIDVREEDSIIISVADNGQGFNEEDLPHIFERFYKGDSGNTGLGMAIVADIVQKHHGTISADNLPELGAMVIIELPITKNKKGLSRKA